MSLSRNDEQQSINQMSMDQIEAIISRFGVAHPHGLKPIRSKFESTGRNAAASSEPRNASRLAVDSATILHSSNVDTVAATTTSASTATSTSTTLPSGVSRGADVVDSNERQRRMQDGWLLLAQEREAREAQLRVKREERALMEAQQQILMLESEKQRLSTEQAAHEQARLASELLLVQRRESSALAEKKRDEQREKTLRAQLEVDKCNEEKRQLDILCKRESVLVAEKERDTRRETLCRLELEVAESRKAEFELEQMRAREAVLAAEIEKENLEQARVRLDIEKAESERSAVELESVRVKNSLVVAEMARDRQREETLRLDMKLADHIASLECVVCLSEIASHIVLPCCHLALCAACCVDERSAQISACPVCRVHVERIARIYLPS